MAIPAIIHQIYLSGELPPLLRDNVAQIRAINPDFEHCRYDETVARRFLQEEYGSDVLARFDSINEGYGAAKADFLRYFLLYRTGGFYLDIKSTTNVPLAQVLRPDDRYILSQWRNGPGEIHATWGLYKEVAALPGGEFQQWFIACEPGHPFLKAVMERVLTEIDSYSPWTHGVGKQGVLRTTGLTYTQAILPLLASQPHRRITNETELGLSYTVLRAQYDHVALFRSHYVGLHTPVIRPATPAAALSARVFGAGHRALHSAVIPGIKRVRDMFKRPAHEPRR